MCHRFRRKRENARNRDRKVHVTMVQIPKSKTVFSFVALIWVLNTLSPQQCVAKDPLDYIGYYSFNGSNDLANVNGMGNIVVKEYNWVAGSLNHPHLIRDDLIAGAEAGVSIVPNLTWFFRAYSDPVDLDRAIRLVRNYVGNADVLIPFIAVLDEPLVWGLTVAEAEAAVDLVKTYFPNTKTWVNHSYSAVDPDLDVGAYPNWPNPAVVTNSDFIGFDQYVFRPVNNNVNNIACQPDGFDPNSPSDMDDWFNDVPRYISCASPPGTYSLTDFDLNATPAQTLVWFKALKAPAQKIIAIGQAFEEGDYTYPTHVQQKLYFDWALGDPDTVGLVWFKWNQGVKEHTESWPVHTAWAAGKLSPLSLTTDLIGPFDPCFAEAEFFKNDFETILHWEFNDGTATDLSGNFRSASVLGDDVSFVPSSGSGNGWKVRVAAGASAVTSAMTIETPLPISGADEITFEFIFQNAALGTVTPFGVDEGDSEVLYRLQVATGSSETVTWLHRDDDTSLSDETAATGGDLTDGQLHYLVLTVDHNDLETRVYYDGAQRSVQTLNGVFDPFPGTAFSNGDNLYHLLASQRDGSPHNAAFIGDVEAVRVSSKVRSVSEIEEVASRMQELFQCGQWGFLPADINRDCYIDLLDFSELAANWGDSNDPNTL